MNEVVTNVALLRDKPMLDTTLNKGKSSTGLRPWSQLPPEIVRLIATHYILDVSTSSHCPATWELSDSWPHRIVYTVFRDAFALEKLMTVCPSWGSALEWHRFWNHACCAVDPLETLAQHTFTQSNDNTSTPHRISPYHQFRIITQCSCYVCRINSPGTNVGLALAKRAVAVPFMGTILTCREHRKSAYCGLCLREAPPRYDVFTAEAAAVGCVENEDVETWPTVATTCRSCRSEWLWRRMGVAAPDREVSASGSPYWSSLDWEVRQSIDAFIESGEGTLGDIIQIAREKLWLSRYTRIGMHMEHALAQQRLDMRTNGYGYESADEDAASGEVDPDDYETLAMAEELHSVREMAQSDWARTRILDGLWLSPADDWYGYRPRPPPAEHPASWALQVADGQVHPTPTTIRVPPAPTYHLADQLYRVYERQLRKILLPAMQNIIKRIMCQGRAEAMKVVASMDSEDVLRALQQAWAWSKDLRQLPPPARESDLDPGTPPDDASSSSKSDASHTTSPVLSTATLQTTPSPPPSDDKREKDGEAESPREEAPRMRLFVEIGPPEPSNLLRDIPYVPATTQEMPSYSLKAFIEVWRESYAPLFACSCKICERALLHRDVGDTVRPAETTTHVVPSHPETFPQRAQQQTTLGNNTIRLEEATYEEEEEDDEDDEELIYSDYSDGDPAAYVEATADVVTPSSRKRDHEHGDHDPRAHAEAESGTLKTPPKRTRVDGSYSPLTTAEAAAARVSKRGSEEAALSGVAAGKRPRVADAGQADGDGELMASCTGTSPTLTGPAPVCLQATGRVGVGGET
ncbi:hypothetical protein EDB85DRAFT_1203388 [Lactarius pseudohatsudake]|nr:hypothetical protein EDB85DRAFT_1203388 [Lactarius pseudohatsudake]